MALTSFLTGVTEPIEFTFMFLAPSLFVLHAVLTGLAMVTMDLLGSRMGFSFSAGFFDYILNYGKASRPLLLIPVGLVYFALYYTLFRFFIVRFGLRTPGREREAVAVSAPGRSGQGAAEGFIAALGGAANLRSVDACTTRLRLVLVDRDRADVEALRRLGASGTVKTGADGFQVVIGPTADLVAEQIRARLANPQAPAGSSLDAALREALGGASNVRTMETGAGRVLVTVKDAARIDEAALRRLGVRGIARPAPGSLQLLLPTGEASIG
jgi:PTS system N-acetylglucosamine-specific IIC component